MKRPDLERPYRTWGYPVTPLVFLGLSSWTLMFMVVDQPRESLAGLLTFAAGLAIYFGVTYYGARREKVKT